MVPTDKFVDGVFSALLERCLRSSGRVLSSSSSFFAYFLLPF